MGKRPVLAWKGPGMDIPGYGHTRPLLSFDFPLDARRPELPLLLDGAHTRVCALGEVQVLSLDNESTDMDPSTIIVPKSKNEI